MDLTMSCSSLSLLFFISLHVHFLLPASSEFQPFQECAPFHCGDQQISYPFRHKEQKSYCGYPGYELGCDGHNLTLLSMESLEYRVIHMTMSTKILEVARMDLSDDICLGRHVDTTLNSILFDYTFNDRNSTLFYDCDSSPVPESHRFSCPQSQDGYFAVDVDHANPPHELCKFSVLVPISQSDDAPALPPLPPEDSAVSAPINRAAISLLLNRGFEITWIANTSQCENCIKSGGRCGYGWKRQGFNCFCADGVHSKTCEGMYAYPHLISGFQLANVLPWEGHWVCLLIGHRPAHAFKSLTISFCWACPSLLYDEVLSSHPRYDMITIQFRLQVLKLYHPILNNLPCLNCWIIRSVSVNPRDPTV
ncbi:LEAF RUST 10 DISEASE-RESISTANCE LOCUS RECEPTOR-LIKE PROTEIN KINASE-like 2.7 [Syzygium oleosum]|uniref:LEAF RUST 10 DISEASE-RESISTANCE LOCUS RECEPTOR-LIKE PROTEIN KINASE-like 2.7 n=1 Tax=Syzygium oleosum TaxID=219896 RepID=UPI0024BB9905|nr:LEAF RUST 10 DISEASE-RESISTANCE LOCUS RECEPTOR-LIKE PROTEIN KINASE-like 2.7 [Syzygium oleosum]